MTKQDYKEALEKFKASHVIDKIYDDFEKRLEVVSATKYNIGYYNGQLEKVAEDNKKAEHWDNIPQEIKDEFEYFWDK